MINTINVVSLNELRNNSIHVDISCLGNSLFPMYIHKK